MAPFYPLYVRRSDGKLEVKAGKARTERNEPSKDQLDIKPNAQGISDFYRECKFGDAKEIDWRRKLAGMLIRELGENQHRGDFCICPIHSRNGTYPGVGKNYILAVLPENYRVYEHIKCRLDPDGLPQKITNNHAGGGNERQDAYLYGHPFGRKKRYRSPAEFFPHLLWLATDEHGDPDNCSCKFCSPEEIEQQKEPQRPVTKDQRPVDAMPSAALTGMPATSSTNPTNTIIQNTRELPVQNQAAQPNALPRFRSHEQKLDAKFNEFFYRPGEIVWFARESAWGLAVVLKRETTTPDKQQSSTRSNQYRVQPLSHPLNHPPAIMRTQAQLRPWLAWSPPPCTTKVLNPSPANNNRIFTFGAVDWQGVLSGRFGHEGDAEVDGSILAAKEVETTFTPIPFGTTASQSSPSEYFGIFLGGEKIWVGEPVRLRNSTSPTDIMIIHSITDQADVSNPGKSTIVLKGDSYAYRTVRYLGDASQTEDLHLPLRIREDLRLRNEITTKHTDPHKQFSAMYVLLTKDAQVRLEDIKGRWYESSLLLPVLNPDYAKQCYATGSSDDIGYLLNSQGACNRDIDSNPIGPKGFKPATVRMSRREDAFGRSIPASSRISAGLDEPRRTSSGGAAPVSALVPQKQTPASLPARSSAVVQQARPQEVDQRMFQTQAQQMLSQQQQLPQTQLPQHPQRAMFQTPHSQQSQPTPQTQALAQAQTHAQTQLYGVQQRRPPPPQSTYTQYQNPGGDQPRHTQPYVEVRQPRGNHDMDVMFSNHESARE